MRRVAATFVLLAAVGSSLSSCGFLGSRPIPPIPPGAVRLATYDLDPGPNPPILCTLGQSVDPVVGTLAGDPDRAPYAVWLIGPGDREIRVLWPRGFSARFGDRVELLDRTGQVVARDGDSINLNLNRSDAAGTIEDPYEVWWINHDCYPPIH